MKKSIVLTFIILLTAFSLYAQDAALGISIPVKYKAADTYNSSFLYKGIGITGIKSLNKRLFLQLDLNYLNAKSTFQRTDPEGRSVNFKDVVNYLSIPATINFKTFNKEGLNLLLSAGFSLDYLLKGKRTVNSTYWTSGEVSGYKDLYFDLGVGGLIPVCNSYWIVVKPQILYWMNSNTSMPNTTPIDFGLKVQMLREL